MTKLTITQKPSAKKPIELTPGIYYRKENAKLSNQDSDEFCSVYLLTAVSRKTVTNINAPKDLKRWSLINIETGRPYNLNSESVDEAFNGQMDEFTQIESIHITVG